MIIKIIFLISRMLLIGQKNFAIGCFWFIPNNYQLKIKWVSNNAGMLTPYSNEEWYNKGLSFCRSAASGRSGLCFVSLHFYL